LGGVIGHDVAGTGPAVLLLHGFPETRLMWREVVPPLAEGHAVVTADLPGYGESTPPAPRGDHAQASKRELATELVALMAGLGHRRFAVVGHDRGGRVAYRMALDHPEVVTELVVLDVLPVDTVWDRADDRLALGFWPWSLLAQPAPLPERLLSAAPQAVIDHAMGPAWGSPASAFPEHVRAAYAAQLADPDRVHAICEEYRAAATVDREHDAADRSAGRRIDCPVLALWSGSGPVGTWYADLGGPLAIWHELADDVTGEPVDGGHFFPEEHPADLAARLTTFLGQQA
jgi:haloacetate dehalogenase